VVPLLLPSQAGTLPRLITSVYFIPGGVASKKLKPGSVFLVDSLGAGDLFTGDLSRPPISFPPFVFSAALRPTRSLRFCGEHISRPSLSLSRRETSDIIYDLPHLGFR
jgi:hypothetical protein